MQSKIWSSLAALTVIVVLWFTVGDIIYETLSGQDKSRLQVTALSDRLNIGMTPAEVKDLTRSKAFDKLKLYEDRDVWIVRAPTVLGAQEWLVVVCFEANRVVGVGVRVADSLRVRPEGAPPDKGRLIVRGRLIRFRGHRPKGGYDVRNGRETERASASAVHG